MGCACTWSTFGMHQNIPRCPFQRKAPLLALGGRGSRARGVLRGVSRSKRLRGPRPRTWWKGPASDPVLCLLCPMTPSRPTTVPAASDLFSFRIVPNCLTSNPATIRRDYTGPREQFTLIVPKVNPIEIHPLAGGTLTKRKDMSSYLITSGLETTDLAFTWPVNIHSGYYKLHASESSFSVTSPEFFVGTELNTSCLFSPPPSAPTSRPVTALPTSDLFVSAFIARFVGGPTPSPAAIPLVSDLHMSSDIKQTGQSLAGCWVVRCCSQP